MSEACSDVAKALVQRRANLTAFLKERVGPDSTFQDLKTRFQAATTLWTGIKNRLERINWTADAVELSVKDAVQADTVLRIDAVFAPPDKTSNERLQRSLVLGSGKHDDENGNTL